MSIKSYEYAAGNQILIAPHTAVTIGCVVGNSGVAAGDDGKMIIKAGTPVGSSEDVLTNRETVLDTSSTPQGVLLHDVDVTDGDANATLVISGTVDRLKLDEDVQTLVDSAASTLTKITFVNGGEY